MKPWYMEQDPLDALPAKTPEMIEHARQQRHERERVKRLHEKAVERRKKAKKNKARNRGKK